MTNAIPEGPLPQDSFPENPWLGLRPYEENESALFFGRTEATGALLRLVLRRAVTIVYGISGIGKTSLLRAGLFPALRAEMLLPVRIRIDFEDRLLNPARQIIAQVEQQAREAGADIDSLSDPFMPPDEETLWEYFHRVRFWQGARMVTPVLVFDQFEEIFTRGSQDAATRDWVEDLITGLADFIENQIPLSVRSRMEETGEVPSFPYDVQAFKVIIALREDYLPNLERLVPRIPSLSTPDRFWVTGMNGEEALEAVLGPGGHVVDEAVARQIVKWVASVQIRKAFQRESGSSAAKSELSGLTVEPFLLSLFCHDLYTRCEIEESPKITPGLIEAHGGKILESFYDSCLEDLAPQTRLFVEDELVGGSGYREMVALEKALSSGISRADIDNLVNRRLIRIDEDRLGISRIELIHDVLIDVVKRRRDTRRERNLRAREEERRREERRRIRRLQIITACFAFLALAAVGAALFAYSQWKRAEKAQQTATLARGQAERLINYMLFDLRNKLEPIGRLDLLKGVAEQAGEYFEKLPAEDVSNESERNREAALIYQADVQMLFGNLKVAGDLYVKAFEIAEALAAREPDNTTWQRDLAVSCERLGDFSVQTSDLKKAEAYYQQALEIAGTLIAGEPNNTTWQRDLAVSCERLGDFSVQTSNLKKAEAYYKMDLEIAEALAAREPGNTTWQRDLAVSLSKLGELSVQTRNLKKAEAYCQGALEIAEALAAREPGNTTWQRDLAVSLNKLGELSIQTRNLKKAETYCQRALEIREALAAREPNNTDWQRDLAISWERIGDLQRQGSNFREAREAYEKELKIALRLFEKTQAVEAPWFISIIYRKLADTCGVLEDMKTALDYQHKHVAALRAILSKDLPQALPVLDGMENEAENEAPRIARPRYAEEQDKSNRQFLAQSLGTLSFYLLFDGQYHEAIASAEEALGFDPTQLWIATKQAHGYLLAGQLEKAEALYRRHAGDMVDENQTFAQAVIDDFAKFRWHGIDNPHMAKVEKMLKARTKDGADRSSPQESSGSVRQ